jgi:hypothetical protein
MQAVGINLGYLLIQMSVLLILLALVVIGIRAIIKYINKD